MGRELTDLIDIRTLPNHFHVGFCLYGEGQKEPFCSVAYVFKSPGNKGEISRALDKASPTTVLQVATRLIAQHNAVLDSGFDCKDGPWPAYIERWRDGDIVAEFFDGGFLAPVSTGVVASYAACSSTLFGKGNIRLFSPQFSLVKRERTRI